MLGEVTALKLRAKFHALHQNNNSCALKGTINRVKGKPRTAGKHLHITHLIGVNIQTMYRTPASQQHNPNTLTQRKGRGLEQTFLRGRCTRGQKQVTSGVPPDVSARLAPVGPAATKSAANGRGRRGRGETEPHALRREAEWFGRCGKRHEAPRNVRNGTVAGPGNPAAGHKPKMMESQDRDRHCHTLVHGCARTVTRSWRRPRCPWTGRRRARGNHPHGGTFVIWP